MCRRHRRRRLALCRFGVCGDVIRVLYGDNLVVSISALSTRASLDGDGLKDNNFVISLQKKTKRFPIMSPGCRLATRMAGNCDVNCFMQRSNAFLVASANGSTFIVFSDSLTVDMKCKICICGDVMRDIFYDEISGTRIK